MIENGDLLDRENIVIHLTSRPYSSGRRISQQKYNQDMNDGVGSSISTAARLMVLAFSFFLFGCSVGPDYLAPEIETAELFDSRINGLSSTQTETQWWKQFDDEVLQSLINRSITGNKDVKVATARLEESRQLLSEARFDYYPSIRTNGSYEQSTISENQARGISRADRSIDIYTAGFDATWELNIFGRVSRENERREALLEVSEANLRDVMVSLISEVGRSYIQLRGDQNRLIVAGRNAENQNSTLKLTQARLDGGQATELDTSRARAQLNNTLATIPPLEAAVKSGIFRVSVLLGEQPKVLEGELSQTRSLPLLPTIVATGDPKTLLQRRPDVRIAERNLAAAVAQVGVATADLYPRITFVGNFGYNASSPNGFDSSSEAWSFGPGISWAAFDLGRVRAIMKASEASAEAVLSEFESTVLLALEETERAFIVFNSTRQTKNYLSEAANASAKAAELANLRYRDGVTDFITVLDAERTMLEAQDRLAQSETDTATSLVAVYKALGGGWETLVDPKPVEEEVASVLP